jgi:putative ABC transport system permease protein
MGLRRLFRFSFRTPRDVGGDVRDEISFHLEMRVNELIDRGWSTDAARREAKRQFGDVQATAEYCRRLDVDKEKDMRLRRYAGELWQDFTYGLRMLYRQPGHSIVALVTIALGVGATTLVFSVIHATLLAPLPYPNADRLMVVRVSLPDYADVRASADVFEDSGVWGSNLYTVGDDQILGGVVSPSFFSTLAVKPEMGRTFDDNDGAAPVVVLSHGLWQRRFGGDPGIVGRTMVISGTAHTIVGVMPARFQFPSRAFQLWASMRFAMTWVPSQVENRALKIFQVVGRLRPTLTPTQAQAQLTTLADRLAATYPETNRGATLTLVSIRDRLVGADLRNALLVALASVGCLLFIACANVAGLTLARLTARTQELAVRAAIGAGRWRIARQLAVESVTTTLCGGVLGVILARLGLVALPALIGDRIPRADEVALSLPVLAVSGAAIILGGLLVAAIPVIQMSMTQIESALRSGPRSGETRFGIRLRSALVVAQIGVAVVVLSGALVLTRSFVRLLHADPGFAPDRLLGFHLPLLNQTTPSGRTAVATRALEAIAALPGVEAAGGATGLALVTPQRGTAFEVEGKPDTPIEQRRAYFIAASPAYFKTLGTTLIRGREFAAMDTDRAPRVAVVSKTLAQRFFGDDDPIGRRLRLINPDQSNDWRTIVGVVGDVRYQGLDDVDPPVIYTPFAQTPFPWIYVHIRAQRDPAALIPSIRQAVKSVDSVLVVANPQPMTALAADSASDPRFRTTLVSLFAAVGMLVAAVGLHGVVAFGVARRAREIAIRVALGASATSVRWRVVRQAMVLALVGVALGLMGAFWMGSLLNGLLYETTATDPLSLTGVAVLLLIVALAASAVPARRATQIQPVEALRDV